MTGSDDTLLRIILGPMFGLVVSEPLYLALVQPIPTVSVTVDLPSPHPQ
jgi:hypothetical protein